MSKIKDISVGTKGIIINKALKKDVIIWSNISHVVIEYNDNYNIDYLKLHIYNKELKLRKILDISVKKSVVKARRHFVTNILTHVDIVLYKNKNQEITKQIMNIIKIKQHDNEDIEFNDAQTKVA